MKKVLVTFTLLSLSCLTGCGGSSSPTTPGGNNGNPTDTPTPTGNAPTGTNTPSLTPVDTATLTATLTATGTSTRTATSSPTVTLGGTGTWTNTFTFSPTGTSTLTPTETATGTPTLTPTATYCVASSAQAAYDFEGSMDCWHLYTGSFPYVTSLASDSTRSHGGSDALHAVVSNTTGTAQSVILQVDFTTPVNLAGLALTAWVYVDASLAPSDYSGAVQPFDESGPNWGSAVFESTWNTVNASPVVNTGAWFPVTLVFGSGGGSSPSQVLQFGIQLNNIPAGASGNFYIDDVQVASPPPTATPTDSATPTASSTPTGTPTNSPTTTPGLILSGLDLSAGSLWNGDSIGVTVTLSQPAGAGGVTVALSVDVPAALSLPASVVVGSGDTSAAVSVTSLFGTFGGDFSLSASLDAVTLTGGVTVLGPPIVIDQVLLGTSGSATNEYFMLKNRTGSSIDIGPSGKNWHIFFANSSGTWSAKLLTPLATTVIPAGGYYLVVSSAAGSGDAWYANRDATYSASSQTLVSDGGVALTSNSSTPSSSNLIDWLGWGSSLVAEGTATGSLANNDALVRNSNGCAETGDNSTDFTFSVSPSPKGSVDTPDLCP